MAKARNKRKEAQNESSKSTKKAKTTSWKDRTASISAKYSSTKVRNSIGLVLLCLSLFLLVAFTSYLFTGNADQSILSTPTSELNSEAEISNWLGSGGAKISQKFIGDWFGISAFSLVLITFLMGFKVLFNIMLLPFKKVLKYSLFAAIWLPMFLGFFFNSGKLLFLGGGIGMSMNHWLSILVGNAGLLIIILFSGLLFILLDFNITLTQLGEWLVQKDNAAEPDSTIAHEETEPTKATDISTPDLDQVEEENLSAEEEAAALDFELVQSNDQQESKEETNEVNLTSTSVDLDTSTPPPAPVTSSDPNELEIDLGVSSEVENQVPSETESEEAVEMEIEEVAKEETVAKTTGASLEELGEYDPTLDLSKFQYPPIDKLEDHGGGGIQIDRDELEANKNRIVDTLRNYKIGIEHIKATIGPTVTLYEIVPEAGVRISKIKNLEDDIALSLSALGIRIIAPIPGRGTIGIEVPNGKPDIVSMRSLIASDKFQNSTAALPVALGKTINNETFVTDLAKMPHLLMAGATGQGKSVGLNAILVSLLYKLHPSQIKFVLVDPKKVELTLFNKIERHYLAKLPDSEEAIITDTTKVIHTLNSLCIEMDQRYELLKDAMVRNLKEYNAKFKARKLNPENGHRYLPYIVLVVDEFADLIMTAGKEVETPIARLAQLARAIGIHLIIATQRPSVNVITGIIKANFPARIAFRVTSKIDSRTILDAGGADQLIGRGDMLLSLGNDLVRLQCGFVDTPEVESITDFIGSQQAYPSALLLPEYVDESSSGGGGEDIADMDRDKLFEDAARIVVQHQQGSASLLQRRLKLGYNRAGRIVDQLEAAGIIGPFEGSKARQVLIPDEMALEQLLEDLR
jgi:S-DNA-T family DNA segregation ATPase FtsK/SpoIIIE